MNIDKLDQDFKSECTGKKECKINLAKYMFKNQIGELK